MGLPYQIDIKPKRLQMFSDKIIVFLNILKIYSNLS